MVVSAIAFTLLGFLSIYLKSAWPLLLGSIFIIFYYFWHWHKVRLELIPVEMVRAARQGEAIVGVTCLLLIFFS